MTTKRKNQLGDSLSGAVQVFSRALNVSEAELFKMMEQGQLVSSEVLPKVAAELKKAALEGGAFDKALQGLRVTEGQMITETQRAGDTIFKSGFSEGLSNLYKTISQILKTSGPQLEKMGKIFGTVFNGIAYSLKLIEPVMKVAIDNFELLFGALAISKLLAFSKTMGVVALSTNAALVKAFLPITLALAAAEELVSLFSDKIVGNIEESAGMQVNLREMTTSGFTQDKEGNLRAGKSSQLFGLDQNSFLGNILSSQRDATSLLNLTAYPTLKGAYNYMFSDGNPSTSNQQQRGNTYIFNNSSADEMKQMIGYVGATSGLSTTK